MQSCAPDCRLPSLKTQFFSSKTAKLVRGFLIDKAGGNLMEIWQRVKPLVQIPFLGYFHSGIHILYSIAMLGLPSHSVLFSGHISDLCNSVIALLYPHKYSLTFFLFRLLFVHFFFFCLLLLHLRICYLLRQKSVSLYIICT